METDFEIPPPRVLSEYEWSYLHRWRDVVTGSQLPTVLRLNKWETPHDLYRFKQGDSPPKEKTVAMRRGHALEPLIHELYEEERGVTLKNAGAYAVHELCLGTCSIGRSVYAYVTTDRFASDGRIVEMKAPLHQPDPAELECYKHQLRLQMKVTGWEQRPGHLAILAGNDRLRIVSVDPYTKEEWDEVSKKIIEFCERCLTDTPDPTWLRKPNETPPIPFGDGVEVISESVAVDAAEFRFLGGLIDGLAQRQAEVRERIYERMLKAESSKLRSKNYKVQLHRYPGGKMKLHMDFDKKALDLLISAGFEPKVSTSSPYTKLFIKRVEEEYDLESDERSDD